MDLTTQPLRNYAVRYLLVLMELRSRRVVHVPTSYLGTRPPGAWRLLRSFLDEEP